MTIGTEILDAVFGASLGRTGRRLSYSPSGGAADESICARPVGNSPAEFKAQILREVEQTKKVVKERNIEFE